MSNHLAIARITHSVRTNQWLVTAVLISILALMLLTLAMVPAHAKSPGSTYCFYSKCHRVKTISETHALIGKPITLHASHYDACGRDRYNPCGLTSSGEKFYPGRADNAASPIYPDGTILLIWNEATRDTAVVRINNAGPYWGNRKLDVSYETANKLGFKTRGVAKLTTLVLYAPTKSQARYSRHRNYTKVPGYIGKFDNLEDAHRITVAIMAVEALAGSASATLAGGIVVASRFETRDVQKQRARVAKKTDELKLAMRAPEFRWPDFATPVATAQTDTRPIEVGQTVTARAPEAPKIETGTPETPRVAAVDVAKVSLRATPVSHSGNSLDTGEWLHPARQAVTLIQTTEVKSGSVEDWLEKGRLGFLFKLSKLETTGSPGKVSALSSRQSMQVANLQRPRKPAPNPGHWQPDARKAGRSAIWLG